MVIANIREKLKTVPKLPGVYQFFNSNNDIIYIGKAKNLRNRVRTYFSGGSSQSPKNKTMVKNIIDLDWIVVRSEVEALMTEANLIKKYQPRYNIDLRDDKTYPYIRITNEPYPQVLLTRTIVKDGSTYFGPFTEPRHLRLVLKALHKVFPIRSCSYFIDELVIKNKKISLCLDYHIKKCEGPCEGLVSVEHYASMINRIKDFMKGKTDSTENYLLKKMRDSSKKQRYEESAIYRDQLNAIENFKSRQSSVATDFTERDVITVSQKDKLGVAVVLRIRNGRIFSREKIRLKRLDDDKESTLKTVITNFYMHSDFIPAEISLQYEPQGEHELLQWLKYKRRKTVKFIYPVRGEKAKELRITLQNSKLQLGEWILNNEKRKNLAPKTLNQLKLDLNLELIPKRIEAFDVSHLGGSATVASLVVFVNGIARKKDYRKYNIKEVKGIDDFAAMREVVYRRYKRLSDESSILPDLILVDGGKGQLSMAISALRKLGLDYIPIVGLAKRLEEVYVHGKTDPLFIPKHSVGLILLKRIRDEAHRFAISFQRLKRKKNISSSIFEKIKGIGIKRRTLLLSSYDSVKEIANLKPQEIKEKTGIPLDIAINVIKLAKENLE